jgi:hypothetical protein
MSSSSVTDDQRGSKSGVTPFVSVNSQAILLELWISNTVNPNLEWLIRNSGESKGRSVAGGLSG